MDARKFILEHNPDAIFIEGLDEALIGLIEKNSVFVALYDESKTIELLMKKENMSYDEALEWFYFNIEGAYLGVNTPVFFTPFPVKSIERGSE